MRARREGSAAATPLLSLDFSSCSGLAGTEYSRSPPMRTPSPPLAIHSDAALRGKRVTSAPSPDRSRHSAPPLVAGRGTAAPFSLRSPRSPVPVLVPLDAASRARIAAPRSAILTPRCAM
eukprot:Amastigsp_a843300_14.p7 type:complete len:120 gc:universal Amastigsp_a843300_14:382-23(-)